MKQHRHQAGAVVDIEPAPGSHSDPRSDDRTAPEGLVEHWADIAVTQATVRTINDPAGHLATVAGIDGPWGFGQSEDEALDDLRSVLVDWASLKLEDGDDHVAVRPVRSTETLRGRFRELGLAGDLEAERRAERRRDDRR